VRLAAAAREGSPTAGPVAYLVHDRRPARGHPGGPVGRATRRAIALPGRPEALAERGAVPRGTAAGGTAVRQRCERLAGDPAARLRRRRRAGAGAGGQPLAAGVVLVGPAGGGPGGPGQVPDGGGPDCPAGLGGRGFVERRRLRPPRPAH